ncbi:Contactin [Strongyloides ratti]|uniref:Contactin n=1 Tax=Strongyloides ratti TaxID=34506 RepID=A0A090LLN1_STRRB|nr:Contactin [Strongyloides ratti]CEF70695.1 Contactin [Strongyloides ratti]
MYYIWYYIILLSFFTFNVESFLNYFSKGFQCPNGWKNVGHKCIKLVYDRMNTINAIKKCKSLSNSELVGFFIDGNNINTFKSELFNIIENLTHIGLNEPVWLLSDQMTLMKYNVQMSDMEYELWNETSSVLLSNQSIAIKVNDKKCCSIISVDQNNEYPFICVLPNNEIKRLLFDQTLIKERTPKLIEMPQSHYFYSSVQDTTIKLNCKTSPKISSNIIWYKGGVEEIKFSKSNDSYILSGGSLIIPIYKDQRDIENYHCVAVNKYGAIRSPTATIVPTYIDKFRSTRLPEYAYSNENIGSKIECQAPKHYPKSYSFSWLHSDSTEKFVSQNERVFISMDGTLFFSYNIKSDAKTYACSIALDTIGSGQYGPFFKFILSPNTRIDGPEHGFPPIIEEYKPQIFPENPSIGKTVYLECFAYGFPSPTYKWSRVDGKKLPSQSKLLNYGRILKIENSQEEDEGKYICNVENSLGSDYSEVHLFLKRPPFFLEKLDDINSHINSTIDLRCRLLINSMHEYYSKDIQLEWFKDGIPINPILMNSEDRVRFIINNDHLTILNAQVRDSGTYQCLATNEISYDTTYSYVKISNYEPKFFFSQFPKKIIAIKGVQLDIPCFYKASPMGTSSWKSLETNDFIGFRKGDVWQTVNESNIAILHFEKLDEKDTGLYECTAQNVIGSSSAILRIVVINKPTIHISNLGWTKDTARLKCEVQMYCDETNICPETQLNWQLNDQDLFNKQLNDNEYKTKINIREISSKYSNGLLKVKQISTLDIKGSIKKRDINRFSCQSIFGTAITEVKPELSFLQDHIILNLDNIYVIDNSLYTDWIIEEDLKKDIRKYNDIKIYLEWMDKNEQKWNRYIEILNEQFFSSNVINFKITNLTEGEYYKLRILLEVGDSNQIQIESNKWIYLFNTTTYNEEYLFEWKKIRDDIIEVSWDFIDLENVLSSEIYYNISWEYYVSHIKNGNNDLTLLTFFDIIQDKNKRIYLPKHDGITQCRKMKIKIIPIINGFNSDIVIKKEITITNNIYNLKATNIRIISLNSTTIKIDWIWDKKNECADAYGTKIICYYKNNENEIERTITQLISNSYTSWILYNLQPETQYNCTIIPVDDNGKHGDGNIYESIITKEEAPKEIPKLNVIDIRWKNNNATLLLQWSPIKLIYSQNRRKIDYINNIGYIIFIYEGSTAEIPSQLKIPLSTFIHPNDLSVELHGLSLMLEYRISVAGYNEGGVGNESKQRIIRIGSYNSFQTISLISSSS